jgi:hypothetical protein
MQIFRKKNQETEVADLKNRSPEQPLEKPVFPEAKYERLASREQETQSPEAESAFSETAGEQPAARPATFPNTGSTIGKSQSLQRIEQVLEENLDEAFNRMDVQHQQMFKRAGEETARQIDGLLSQAKVKVQKIFELIKTWLLMIPGINKWFVIQEAKIKTDKLRRLDDKK